MALGMGMGMLPGPGQEAGERLWGFFPCTSPPSWLPKLAQVHPQDHPVLTFPLHGRIIQIQTENNFHIIFSCFGIPAGPESPGKVAPDL